MTHEDYIHEWFNLTYASYLVLPRTLLQSMPKEWQKEFVKLLEELDNSFDLPDNYTSEYWIRMKDANGKFAKDPFRDYDRGRRIISRREED
jgi:hypothetical protein